jgi:hypothetical protein
MADDARSLLLRRLRHFLSDDRGSWIRPLLRILRSFDQSSSSLFFFGGLPRDLIAYNRPRQPRDVDLVMEADEVETVLEKFEPSLIRRNRFGGLRLDIHGWAIDVWPASRTWAFQAGIVGGREVQDLPRTTFFNVEAIVVELAPRRTSRKRRVYEHGFFDALARRELDINLEDNPYPALCIVRAMVLSRRLRFSLSPKLVGYIVYYSSQYGVDQLLETQRSHYGRHLARASDIALWIDDVRAHNRRSHRLSFPPLPAVQQLQLFD